MRGAWIEMPGRMPGLIWESSLPVRGAWIEMLILRLNRPDGDVAPRAGSVD